MIKPRHRYNSILAKLLFLCKPKNRQWAFVLGKRVFYRYPDDGDLVLRNHENIHVGQYSKHGICGFLYQYFVVERHKGYKEKSFEIEAYDNERDFTYPERAYGVIDDY